jgi:hypothetical protein
MIILCFLISGVTAFGRHWTGNRLVILSTTCTYTASLVVTYFFLREIRANQLPEDDAAASGAEITHSEGAADARGDGEIGSGRPYSDEEHGIEMTTNGNARHGAKGGPPMMGEAEDSDPGRYSEGTTTSADASNPPEGQAAGNSGTDGYTTFVPEQRNLYTVWVQLVSSPTFWRFSVLTLFLINLNTIFRHLDATLPTYLVRCFGASYPKGIVYSINPFIIMWLTPVIAALTSTYAHYDMIKYGGYVSALSPFFMVVATETWAVVLFVVFLSLGEAIWSPRVYDYTMSIAPEVRCCDCVLKTP